MKNVVTDDNPIDQEYWLTRIEAYLTDKSKKMYSPDIFRKIDKVTPFYQDEMRFYITGFNGPVLNFPELNLEVKETLPHCSLKFDDKRPTAFDRTKFYISVTPRAQDCAESKGYLTSLFFAKLRLKETWLLMILIGFLFFFLNLLYSHIKDYKLL